MLFDIIIPLGPNDTTQIHKVIEHASKNIVGYRNIFIISKNEININNCIFINESIFPFKISDVASIQEASWRNGWYYQQLLKLYSSEIIPGLLDRYLIIDADTFFLRKVEFINPLNNKCLYNFSSENHRPYYQHMKKMDDSFDKVLENSAICHHMMFEKKYVKELFDIVEKKHNKPFWRVFLELVDKSHYLHSGASEYELYGNFMFKFHPEKVELRQLNWSNVNTASYLDPNYSSYHYVSYHWYNRR
jgi:hypothetical protein